MSKTHTHTRYVRVACVCVDSHSTLKSGGDEKLATVRIAIDREINGFGQFTQVETVHFYFTCQLIIECLQAKRNHSFRTKSHANNKWKAIFLIFLVIMIIRFTWCMIAVPEITKYHLFHSNLGGLSLLLRYGQYMTLHNKHEIIFVELKRVNMCE